MRDNAKFRAAIACAVVYPVAITGLLLVVQADVFLGPWIGAPKWNGIQRNIVSGGFMLWVATLMYFSTRDLLALYVENSKINDCRFPPFEDPVEFALVRFRRYLVVLVVVVIDCADRIPRAAAGFDYQSIFWFSGAQGVIFAYLWARRPLNGGLGQLFRKKRSGAPSRETRPRPRPNDDYQEWR